MSLKIAHDLDSNKWRSEDIRISLEENEREESEVTFSSLNLKSDVFLGLKTSGFIRPSPIQLQAIPLGRCGLDLIVQSKSGTGKTCVFVVVALEMIQSNATQVLIIAPTREIAVQITQVVNALSSQMPNITCSTAIGGTRVKEDKDKLKSCQIVVGTPGRVKQLIELGLLKTNSIRLLVLDECDKLLDNNFKQQIDDIFESLPENKQMIAVSATMANELALFLSKYMRTPAFVRLSADNPALIGVTQYYRITDYHHLNHINFDNKIEPLIKILKKIPFSQCLIFSNYQTRARMLCDKLNANNWPTTYISSEKCQTERLKALSKLKKYKCRILVSTDLTARGIDVENINLVINMDVPFDAETYLHRIGRAGRFGSRGIAITIASDGRELEQFQKIIKDCKLQVEQLSHPIPENLWNSVSSLECFSLKESYDKSMSQSNESINEIEEYNPWDRFSHRSHLSNESSSKWISFNDIVNDYNMNKNSIKTTQKELISDQVDGQNTGSTPLETDCDYIEKVFSDKCSISTNESNSQLTTESNRLETNNKCDMILNSKDSEISDCVSTNHVPYSSSLKGDLHNDKGSQNCDKKSEKPCFNRNNQNSFENNYFGINSCSANLIQSGFNQWATALFPPISSVRNPLQYNDWMDKNRFLWSYMINPFQAFEMTLNANQRSFNNNNK